MKRYFLLLIFLSAFLLKAGTSTIRINTEVWGESVAPSIISQPANTALINSGSPATFTVVASGTPSTFTYQWQRLNKGGSIWSNLTEGNPYIGTTTATLTVSKATPAMNGDQFRCIVSNGVSPDATSNAATLNVSNSGIHVNVNQSTFILSNEANGYLITQLVKAGYGSDNIYQALVDLVASSNPRVSAIITNNFLQTLANAPVSAKVFTTKLSDVDIAGKSIAINTDGTVETVSIFGSAYYGSAGTTTLISSISGVGNENFTYSTTSPVTSWTVDGPLAGMTTTYDVFAIGWAKADTLSVSGTTLNIAYAGGSTATFMVTSNTAWTIASDQTWLSADVATGTGNKTITLTAQTNTLPNSRIATVTVSATGTTPQTIQVTQSINTAMQAVNAEKLLVYPNPFTEGIHVQGITTRAVLSLTDLSSRVLLEKEVSGDGYIGTANLPAGMYLLKVVTAHGTIKQKLIKR